MIGSATRFLKDRGATSAIEFAFILPILLTLIGGTVEFGRWFVTFDAVNRLAARYASVYSDCNDNPSGLPVSPQACNAELALYWPAAAIANVAPQLSNGTTSVRMFQVQYSSTGTATVVYSYPANATMTSAESSAASTAIYSSGSQQTGVLATIKYTFVPIIFPQIFQQLAPNGVLNLSYSIAQRKT